MEEGEGLLSQHLSRAGPGEVCCVCVWWGDLREEGSVRKSVGIQPSPLRLPHPVSPTTPEMVPYLSHKTL